MEYLIAKWLHILSSTLLFGTDFRNISPRFSTEARAANQSVVDLLKSIADSKGGTPAQVVLGSRYRYNGTITPYGGLSAMNSKMSWATSVTAWTNSGWPGLRRFTPSMKPSRST